MGPTPKRHDPAKRGRFNMGEKELVSVADGHTVHFPRITGRIAALMPWPRRQAGELIQRLKRFHPKPDVRNLLLSLSAVQRHLPGL